MNDNFEKTVSMIKGKSCLMFGKDKKNKYGYNNNVLALGEKEEFWKTHVLPNAMSGLSSSIVIDPDAKVLCEQYGDMLRDKGISVYENPSSFDFFNRLISKPCCLFVSEDDDVVAVFEMLSSYMNRLDSVRFDEDRFGIQFYLGDLELMNGFSTPFDLCNFLAVCPKFRFGMSIRFSTFSEMKDRLEEDIYATTMSNIGYVLILESVLLNDYEVKGMVANTVDEKGFKKLRKTVFNNPICAHSLIVREEMKRIPPYGIGFVVSLSDCSSEVFTV